ncbi:hypothetical protein JCM17380_18850 [Desulfosporosinus burensis]
MQPFIPCVSQAKLTPQPLAPAGYPATRHDGHDSNRTFEVRAPPWMARRRDGLVSPEPWMVGGDALSRLPADHVLCSVPPTPEFEAKFG